MALRNSPKDDLAGFSTTDMTLGHPIRLPGEFFDDTNGFEDTDTNLFVSRFGRYVLSLRFMPPRRVNRIQWRTHGGGGGGGFGGQNLFH